MKERELNSTSPGRIIIIKRLIILLILLGPYLLFSQNHTVKSGETLYSISLDYSVEIGVLRDFNNLEGSFIKEGDTLSIPPSPSSQEKSWVVERGDSLSLIAYKENTTVETLMSINHLSNERIIIGQELKLPQMGSSRTYFVQRGDSLWSISEETNTTIEDISRVNHLESETIIPGMELTIPFITTVGRGTSILKAMVNHPLSPEKGPWFNREPELHTQPSLEYGELSKESTGENYARARDIMDKLDREIDLAGLLSRDLKGWTIVIDPGHGGLDPGTVVQTTDGQGNSAFVVEDEYAYDIALRVYALLKQHGADADLTIISPNHHIRHTPDASLTFVNEKNEVYNSQELNRTGAWSEWPSGGSQGLEKRLIVAEEIIKREKNRKTLFLSIHCDNTPGGFPQSGILIGGDSQEELERSQQLAQAFKDVFPSDLEIKEQSLHVLGNNPASRGAVLVEVRNIYYDKNSWALRNEEIRDQDVERIVESVLNFASP